MDHMFWTPPTPRPPLPALLVEPGAVAILLASMLAIIWGLAGAPRMARYIPQAPPPATGLHALERRADDGLPYRWTFGAARLDLPNPGGPLLLRLQLAAGARRAVAVALSGATDASLHLGPELRYYTLMAPPQPGERFSLDLAAAPFVPPGETREIGVMLGTVEVWGGGAAPSALVVTALLTSLALYAAIRPIARRSVATTFAGLITSGLLAWHLSGRWVEWTFAPLGAVAVIIAVIVTVGLPLVLRAWARCRVVGRFGEDRAPQSASPIPAASAARHGTPRSMARTVALLILIGAAIALYLAVALWNHLYVHSRLRLDLEIYLRAGHQALNGQSPYDPPALNVIGVSFIYPPPTVPLFAALAAIEPWLAYSLWRVGSVALYLLALLGMYAALPGRPSRLGLAGMLGLGLGFAPFLENLAIGQINSLMLLGIVLFLLGYVDRRLAWLGDFGLASAILIKLTPAALLLWPLLRGDLRRLGRVGAGLLLLSLPALVLYGPALWMDFARLLPALLDGAPRNPYNQAAVAMLVRLTPPGSSAEQIALWLGRGLSLGLLAVWVGLCWRGRAAVPALAWGVAMLTVNSSLVWHHHLMFLTLPLAWLALGGPTGRLGLALLALALIQLTRPLEMGLGAAPWTAVAGYLIILAACGIDLWRDERGRQNGRL